ncbi:MAG: SDR family oxidoreductase [Sandaracinaceae bacterium]|jgi:NAD(P)-dependent dehydrogenase (short-subunit alcohol dehydrogenase family)|nr:SDR family oxidoreductase [Sandaracinaceae bacterium]MBP7680293.1 SDR family oxidoreductase [Deltaproteobacteria bacterium]MBK7154927.1 SDR family oxidoreductase [Sandaracinaceae bacterium]MBK7772934.1 SDR family oxidoreductase [Sandaracinaceae bacterium]MBK8407145.1 SDR family oxidoreductase [Sandaracinaceae bacterium]
MDVRHAVVTGGSSGIGLETARGLLRRGFERVAIVGRDPARLERAVTSLGAGAIALRADFSSLTEVRECAAQVRERLEPLAVLVNNAGVWHSERTLSQDGFEDTFAVNHLAHFEFTRHLLDHMADRAALPARIVHVSSRRHVNCKGIRWDDVMLEKGYSGLRAYDQSKLANLLFSLELARRLRVEKRHVRSNAVHPGSVATDIARDSGVLSFLSNTVARLVLLTPEQGAATSLHAATHPSLDDVSGRYFSRSQRAQPSRVALDELAAARLWALSESLIEGRHGAVKRA